MDRLGKSIERFKNGGAQFAFWAVIVIIVFFIGFLAFMFDEIDSLGKTMLFVSMLVFCCLAVYMYFKAKTEVDLRENGIYVRNVGKKHEILYNEIVKLDKTKRIGKSGNMIIVFYLLVIVKKDGERVTLPFRITEEFLMKFIEIGHLAD